MLTGDVLGGGGWRLAGAAALPGALAGLHTICSGRPGRPVPPDRRRISLGENAKRAPTAVALRWCGAAVHPLSRRRQSTAVHCSPGPFRDVLLRLRGLGRGGAGRATAASGRAGGDADVTGDIVNCEGKRQRL